MKNKKSQPKKNKVLLFSAHPDDHISCAGTLMYFKDKGFDLVEVVFTGGEKSVWIGNGDKKIDGKELKELRVKELSKASEIIGVSSTSFLNCPDTDVRRSVELLEKVMEIIRRERPDIVITQSPTDYHHDHRVIGEIVAEASDRAAWGISKELGEPHRVSAVLYMEGCFFNRPDILVDISDHMERKQRVFSAYGSQLGPRAKKLFEAMNTYRGYFKRTEYAEAFEIAKNYPVYLNEVFELFDNEKK